MDLILARYLSLGLDAWAAYTNPDNLYYEALPATTLADGALSLCSVVLGLDVRLEQGRLRFFDPATEAYLLTYQESEQARQAAEARLAELQARFQALEAERPAPPSPPDAVKS